MARTQINFARAKPFYRAWLRRWVVDSSLPSSLKSAIGAGELDALIAQGTLLQAKPRCTVSVVEMDQQTLLVKRHTWGDLGRTLRMALRTPAARKCFMLGKKLAESGIPTPAPRALVEDRLAIFGYRSYLVTDFQPGASLFHYVRNAKHSQRHLSHLADQVATIWQRLIDLGICHNDMKPENFIVDHNQKVWLIDVEKMRLGCSDAKLVAHHLADVREFLHVRHWRTTPDAAGPFRAALAATDLGEWASTVPEHPLNQSGFTPAQLAQRVSVAIVSSDPNADRLAIKASAASVADLADEVAIVRPMTLDGQFVVESPTGPHVQALSHPWVLVLRAGECLTPDLTRLLGEYIVDQPQGPPVRLEVEELVAGCRLPLPTVESTARFYRQKNAACRLDQQTIALEGDDSEAISFNFKLCRSSCLRLEDYRARVSIAAELAARDQFEQGERPRFASGLAGAMGELVMSLVKLGLIQQGRAGFRVAWERAKFDLIRVAHCKLLWANPPVVEPPAPNLPLVANAPGSAMGMAPSSHRAA